MWKQQQQLKEMILKSMLTSVARDFPNSRENSPSPHGGCWQLQCLGALLPRDCCYLDHTWKLPGVYSHLYKCTNLASLLALHCPACLLGAPRGLQLTDGPPEAMWRAVLLGDCLKLPAFCKTLPQCISGPEPDGNEVLGEGPLWYNWWECEHF